MELNLIMRPLQKLVLSSAIMLCLNPAAQAASCALVDAQLNIEIPCVAAGSDALSANLSFTQTLIPGEAAWELRDYALTNQSNECGSVSEQLNLQLPCLSFQNNSYQVNLNAHFDPIASQGVYWTLGAAEPISPPPTDTTIPTDNNSTDPEPTTPASPWQTFSHPCAENRTDAFWWDDDTTAWVGCGTGVNGRGLWTSTDTGESWTEVKGFMETWRVNGIRRADDGRLYVSGTDTSSSNAVVSFDTSVSPYDARLEFSRGDKVSLSFTAEHIMVDSQGNAFTDSLTGAGSAYRAAGSDSWVGLDSTWTSDGSSHQILDMVMFNDKIYGVGSTISQPPQVFLPSANAEHLYDMTPVDLSGGDALTNIIGEMWGVTVLNESQVIAVGIDQNRNVGLIFASQQDPYDAADYHKFDVSSILPDTSSWLRGVCSQGEKVVAVGEKQPLRQGTGIVLLSTDGGLSFENITDPNITAQTVSRCHFLSDGRLAVAGYGGYVGIYTP